MKFNILYEDKNVLVIDKPANITVFSERPTTAKCLIDYLLKKFPYLKNVGKFPRYGIVHRLDKETSGILLVAKNNKSLFFFQKRFKERKIIKKYIALVFGSLKKDKGEIETLIGRSPKNRRRQKVYLPFEPKSKGKRKAVTKYNILRRLKDYTLVEVEPKTGRKHQIRVHFNYLGHPIVGDKIYGFKDQPPTIFGGGLKRQFLHAVYLKTKLPDGREKEFKSALSEDLRKTLEKLNEGNK